MGKIKIVVTTDKYIVTLPNGDTMRFSKKANPNFIDWVKGNHKEEVIVKYDL